MYLESVKSEGSTIKMTQIDHCEIK